MFLFCPPNFSFGLEPGLVVVEISDYCTAKCHVAVSGNSKVIPIWKFHHCTKCGIFCDVHFLLLPQSDESITIALESLIVKWAVLENNRIALENLILHPTPFSYYFVCII